VSETVLLTGATGFIGMEVLVRLLEGTDHELVLLVRAEDDEHARRRVAAVIDTLYDATPGELDERVTVAPGDISEPDLGLDGETIRALEARTTSIVHCAASVGFDTSLGDALAVNTLGTARVLAVAQRLHAAGSLRRLVHVSTAYVCGRRVGTINESDLVLDTSFRNHYERSKAYAEHLLRCCAQDLPLIVARPSIVVGDSRTGWTPTFNVVYWPLRAFERGLVGTLPGDPDGILDIVPCDYVADAIIALHAGAVDRATVHLVAGQAATTNGELGALAARHMNRQLPEFNGDAGGLAQLDGALLYLPYLDVRASFADPRAQELLADEVDPPPSLEDYLGTLLGYARATRWGKRPISRARALTPSTAQASLPR
jgi:thioester reductase-like protein